MTHKMTPPKMNPPKFTGKNMTGKNCGKCGNPACAGCGGPQK